MTFTGALTKVFPEVVHLFGGIALEGGSVQLAQRDVGAGASVQGTGDPQDTSVVIPADSVVDRVMLQVETAESTGTTKTVDIGVAGSVDSLAADLDVSSTGIKLATPDSAFDSEDTITVHADSGDFAELEATLIVEYRVLT